METESRNTWLPTGKELLISIKLPAGKHSRVPVLTRAVGWQIEWHDLHGRADSFWFHFKHSGEFSENWVNTIIVVMLDKGDFLQPIFEFNFTLVYV